MNIFALDNDPVRAARWHSDRHVIKMILETAQILSTVHHGHGHPVTYKPTHPHHPCTLWAGATAANYRWLQLLGLALCAEYTSRYGKTHACEDKLCGELAGPPAALSGDTRTPFALAMPEACKRPDPVESYRRYYQHKADENSWMRWAKLNNPPAWITPRADNVNHATTA
jgi:hypothetical protein